MAIKYSLVPGKRSSLKQDESYTLARKFGRGEDGRYEQGDSTDHRDNYSAIAGASKTSAGFAVKFAEIARENLRLTRQALDAGPSSVPGDSRKNVSSFSENDLDVARSAMVRDVTVSDPSLASAGDIVTHAPASVLSQEGTRPLFSPNIFVPDFEHLLVDLGKKKGIGDAFYARLTFNLPLKSADQVKAIRIFRSETPGIGKKLPRLSVRGMEILMAYSSRRKSKNQDYLSKFELQLSQRGIDNALSSLAPRDGLVGNRLAVTPRQSGSLTSRVGTDDVVAADLSSYVDPQLFDGVDRSVARNLNSLQNMQRFNPGQTANLSDDVNVGRSVYVSDAQRITFNTVRDVRARFDGDGNLVNTKANAEGFKEIAFVSPESPKKIRSRIVGDLIEYTFDDPTVQYGSTYRYYITSVDGNMNESPRSRIVETKIDGLRIPDYPKTLTLHPVDNIVTLSVTVDDTLVEKFEVYRRDDTDPLSTADSATTQVVSGKDGYLLQTEVRNKLASNFIQIGEALNGKDGGASFYDRTVKGGRRYTYRVYSVDVFGNKSEAPRERSIFVKDPVSKSVELRRPSIMTEVDSASGKVKVTVSCDDTRIIGFFLTRRDMTTSQQAFTVPGEVNMIRLGKTPPRSAKRLLDAVISDSEVGQRWNGFIRLKDGLATFIDRTADVDHTYQYRVYGVDRFGNKTSQESSRPIIVVNRRLINTPVNLSGMIFNSDDGSPRYVRVSWEQGGNDVTTEDRLGSRTLLNDTSVRTLYQLERRRAGEDVWKPFQMVEEKYLNDYVISGPSGSDVSDLRPEYLKMNETYLYRVTAYQSGAYISNFSTPISVDVTTTVKEPTGFRIYSPSAKQRPFYVVLNWDTRPGSGDIDRWEIERAAVNNYAAARLDLTNQDDFNKLKFVSYRTVYKESSRFRERTDDATVSASSDLTPGEHHYLDQAVDLGNTYVYRIRSVPTFGTTKSNWVYRAIRVTDDSFEKKLDILLTSDEKRTLTDTFAPAKLKSDYLVPSALKGQNTFSLVASHVRNALTPTSPEVTAQSSDLSVQSSRFVIDRTKTS